MRPTNSRMHPPHSVNLSSARQILPGGIRDYGFDGRIHAIAWRTSLSLTPEHEQMIIGEGP
jgi:hypothetical protein